MFTSRAEYRILLRQDNADIRLTPLSYNIGLADKFRYDYTMRKYDSVSILTEFFNKASIRPEDANLYLEEVGTSLLESKKKISDLISRPQVSAADIIKIVPHGTFKKFSIDPTLLFDNGLSSLSYKNSLMSGSADEIKSVSYQSSLSILKFNTDYPVSELSDDVMKKILSSIYKCEILESTEIAIKYSGYIERENQLADKLHRLENLKIPDGFDFDRVESLSIESRQKLKKYAPQTIAQASRISGVSPSDISVLLVYFGR